MIEIKFNNDEQVISQLGKIIQSLENRQPLMRRLSGTMYSAVMQNFDAGGRPAWQGISHRNGKPLNDTGALRGSISESASSDEAVVGTNLIYAAIHQFGGVIRAKNAPYLMVPIGNGFRRVKQVTIKPRPYLSLTMQDEADLLQDAQEYFQSLL